jgi:hypothetical protein
MQALGEYVLLDVDANGERTVIDTCHEAGKHWINASSNTKYAIKTTNGKGSPVQITILPGSTPPLVDIIMEPEENNGVTIIDARQKIGRGNSKSEVDVKRIRLANLVEIDVASWNHWGEAKDAKAEYVNIFIMMPRVDKIESQTWTADGLCGEFEYHGSHYVAYNHEGVTGRYNKNKNNDMAAADSFDKQLYDDYMVPSPDTLFSNHPCIGHVLFETNKTQQKIEQAELDYKLSVTKKCNKQCENQEVVEDCVTDAVATRYTKSLEGILSETREACAMQELEQQAEQESSYAKLIGENANGVFGVGAVVFVGAMAVALSISRRQRSLRSSYASNGYAQLSSNADVHHYDFVSDDL